MAYYNTCTKCGCNLDPGEKCDCEREKAEKEEKYKKLIRVEGKNGQMALNLFKEARYERKTAI